MNKYIKSSQRIKHILAVGVLVTLLFTPNSIFAKDYVIISEVMYDSPLNEQIATGVAYSNGEYIELYNAGIDNVDLTNWSLKGGGSTEIYTFPANTILTPKSYLIVAYQHLNSGFTLDQLFAGFATDTDKQVQYQRKIILSNSGEALKLRSPDGTTKDSLYIDGTTNKTKPYRLSAENADGIAGNACLSIQRKTSVFDADGNAITNNQEWTSTPVTIYNQTATYSAPAIPGVTNTAVSSGQNYIISVTPLDATSQVDIDNGQIALHNEARGLISIQYFDGLGRPVQTVQQGITPENSDLVSYTQYDGVGREWKQWLPTPIANNKGAFVGFSAFASAAKTQMLYNNDSRPFSEIKYEPSPLNRIQEQFDPGQDWETNNKRVQTNYQTNAGDIACYFVNNSNNLEKGVNYAPNTLFKTQVTDEDGNNVVEYKDKLGQVVLKQSFDRTNAINTYYVYNNLGQLSYVIPPKAVDELTADLGDDNTTIKQLCYLYKYDERGNCIKKRLPGCDWINMVYDKADRLVLSQDGNQRLANKWTVNKYDALGRALYTGVLNETTSHDNLIEDLKDEVITESWNPDNDFNGIGYTCDRFTPVSLLTVNYYDDYAFVPLTDSYLDYNATKESEYGIKHTSAKGLMTGSRVYSLNDPEEFTSTSMYYDYQGRIIQTRSSNYLGGYDIAYSKYTFTGNILKTEQMHSVSADYPPGNADVSFTENTEIYTYDYDHAGKLTATKRNGLDFTKQKYNELGQLAEKTTYGGIDITTYKYNIRGWLKNIDGTHFNQELYYNNSIAGAEACFNGNISAMQWKSFGETKMRGYTFEYDNLNRLLNANYGEESDMLTAIGRFDENLTYDKMGNIMSLQRKGVGDKFNNNLTYFQIDNLGYSYNGNQLKTVNDYAEEEEPIIFAGIADFKDRSSADKQYFYDVNGNMTKDLNKGIESIQYNLLNLPQEIIFVNGDRTLYKYNASGTKYQVIHYTHLDTELNPVQGNGEAQYKILTYDYNGSYVYKDHYFNMLMTPEGYMHLNEMTPEICFYAKDHLGNNRATYYVTPISELGVRVKDINNYYPFGMEFNEKAVETNIGFNPELDFTYNGKESQTMHGLNMMDYGARFIDMANPVWIGADPLSEKHYDISPYAYCLNNPINYIDPLGLDTVNVNSGRQVNKGDVIVGDKGVIGTVNAGDATVTGIKPNVEEPQPTPKVQVTEVEQEDNVIESNEFVIPIPVAATPAVAYLSKLLWVFTVFNAIGSDTPRESSHDQFAHKPKKQSTGKSKSDRHDAQYRHGGKNRPKNANQRKGADKRRNQGREDN